LFFVVMGGTIGYLYGPGLLKLMNLSDASWLTSPILGSLIGAIIFFILSYWLALYIVGFLKWVEDALVRIPVGDLLFGTIGLMVGLVVAYLITIPLAEIKIGIISQVI